MIHFKIENSEMSCEVKRLEEKSKNKKEVTLDEVKVKESEVTDKEIVFNCENCQYHSSCENSTLILKAIQRKSKCLNVMTASLPVEAKQL